MVRSWSLPSTEQQEEDPCRFYDFDSCFLDHFPDFDPIKEWLVDPFPNPMPDSDILKDSDGFALRSIDLGHQEPILEASIGEKMEKVSLVESKMDPNSNIDNHRGIESNMEVGDNVTYGLIGEVKKDGVSEVKIDAASIVCLVTDPIEVANESNEEESSEETEEDGEDSSSESSCSSSSSSSDEEEESSSSNDEEKDDDDHEVAPVEVEEGELNGGDLEEVILASDGEEEVPKGPIKSKHEIEELPPVPPLEVSLKPHHQTLPVGFVSSILGNRVIVEGSEKHSPLNEGSVLWITETRSPLGRIDEIFGPVKNPYYIVRYNSDKEVPQGISTGVSVSFVVDFANHILNEKSLYQKGYDASGVDDEEVTDEGEFSDDEKEAEYKRSLRQNKRDANHGKQESGFGKKKTNFKGAGFHRDKQLQLPYSLPASAQPLPSQPSQVQAPPAVANFGCSNCDGAHGAANLGGMAASPMTVPALPSQSQAFHMGITGSLATTSQQLNTVSTQGYPTQPQAIGIQGGGFAPQPSPAGIQGGGFAPLPIPAGIQGGFPPQPQPMGMQGGFLSQPQLMALQGGHPMNWLSAQQFGDQTYNLHQNQGFNNFAGGIMPYLQHQQQQQQQQLVSNVTSLPCNLPWFSGTANPSLGPSSILLGLMGQGQLSQVPFGCGNVNPQGSLALSNEQGHGQAPSAVNQGEMRPPSMQFNGGQFNRERSSSRGRRPYQRGGHRFFGRRGGNQQNG